MERGVGYYYQYVPVVLLFLVLIHVNPSQMSGKHASGKDSVLFGCFPNHSTSSLLPCGQIWEIRTLIKGSNDSRSSVAWFLSYSFLLDNLETFRRICVHHSRVVAHLVKSCCVWVIALSYEANPWHAMRLMDRICSGKVHKYQPWIKLKLASLIKPVNGLHRSLVR